MQQTGKDSPSCETTESNPQNINILTTYRCNSRCINCSIWKNDSDDNTRIALDDKELAQLAEDPLFSRCRSFGLSGGEPTIAPFFWKVFGYLPKEARVHISTNALHTERLLDFLRKQKDKQRFDIQVSIDGIGEKNDFIRGIPGAFQKSIAFLEALKQLEINRILSFTINNQNYDHLKDCYDLAESLGAEFSTRTAHTGGSYHNRESRALFELDEKALEVIDRSVDQIIENELGKTDHFPALLVFMKKMADYCRGKHALLPCSAYTNALVMDLYGDVFPKCPKFMVKGTGNLHDSNLSEIWHNNKTSELREYIDKLKCGGCWNDCQMISNIDLNRDYLDDEYGLLLREWFEKNAPPDSVRFTDREERLLISGWYDLEGERDFRYRWSKQNFTVLLPKGTARILLSALVPSCAGSNGTGRLTLTAEDELLAETELSESGAWDEYEIRLNRPLSHMTLCRFYFDHYYCPSESGVGNDGRKLGLAVSHMIFR